MKIYKNLTALFLAVIMLCTVLPPQCVAASLESEETVYENGNTYLYENVKYRISGDKAYVVGYADDIPENLVIAKKIGGFTVAGIRGLIFKNKENLKSVRIPSGCEEICDNAFSDCINLETVIAECDYVRLGENIFENTPFYEKCKSESDGVTCIFDGKWVLGNGDNRRTEFEFDENICSVANGVLPNQKMIITVRNRNCVFNVTTNPFMYGSEIHSYKGSTAETLAKTYKNQCKFYSLCEHEGTVTVPGSEPDCVGLSGYTQGEYCEICGFVRGHKKIKEFKHKDTDGDGICDNCTADANMGIISGGNHLTTRWVLLEDGTLVVSGTGSTGRFDVFPYLVTEDLWPKALIPSIKKIVVREGITEIGKHFFAGLSAATELELPEGLVTIGEAAFRSCNAIKELNLPSTVTKIENYAFSGWFSLKKLELPESIKRINEGFSFCGLEEVKLPQSMTYVEAGAFEDCSSLKKVVFGSEVTSIGAFAFEGCKSLEYIELPAKLKTIGEWAFYRCSSLKETELPQSVTTIGDSAFRLCSSLKEIKLPQKVTTIGDSAFSDCTALRNIELNDGLITIADWAFKNTAIEEIVIPDSVRTIENYVFYGCAELERITLGTGLTQIGEDVIAGTKVKTVTLSPSCKSFSLAFKNAPSLEKVIIPEGVETINKNYLYKCPAKEIVLPASVKKISDGAFSELSGLEKINLDNVESIGKKAFYNCESLEEVNFSEKLVLIDELAFYKCAGLTQVSIPASVRKIGAKAFNFCKGITDAYIYTEICDEMEYGTFAGDTVIHAYEYSPAHKYAEKYEHKFTKLESDETPHEHEFVRTVDGGVCGVSIRYKFKCALCDINYTQTEYYPFHIFGEDYVTITEATCLDDGVKAKICLCGKETRDKQTVLHTGHTVTVDNIAVPPTETQPGWTQGSHCEVCGTVLETKIFVDPNDFDIYVSGDTVTAVKVLAATFTQSGTQTEIVFTKRYNSVQTQVKETVIYKIGKVSLSQTSFICDGKVHRPAVTVLDYCGEKISENDYVVTYSSTGSNGVGAYTVNVKFINNYSGERTLSYKITPANVGSASASAAANSVRMSWQAVAGAQGYRIYDSGKKLIAEVKETGYIVNNLKAGMKHRFYVRAFTKVGNEIFLSASYTLLEAVTSPSNVSGFAAKSVTCDSVTLKWNKTDGADGYRIYKYDSDTKKYTLIADTKGTSYKYSSLTAGKGYTVYIKAYSVVDSKTVLSPSYVKLKIAAKPNTPSFTLSGGKGTATINITEVYGAAGYEIYMSEKKDGTYKKIATVKKNAYTKKKLKAAKKYYFKVRAYKTVDSKKLYGSFSKAKSVKVK